MLAGGLLESASTVKIDINRRVKNPASTTQTDTIGTLFTFAFKDGYVLDGEAGFLLEPYDVINVRRSPGYQNQATVTIYGEAIFPGNYVMTHKEERMSDLVKKAGGLNSWAYVTGARLVRKMTPEEKLRHQSQSHLLKDTPDSLIIDNLSDACDVAIDLGAALANPGSDADLVLRPDDALLIPEYINTVKISGNVMYPNVVAYDSAMSVRDYVEMAGGYCYRSNRNKAYTIYMNGTIARARQLSKGVVEPGCEIVIPQKRDKEFDVSSMMSVATTSSSVATMLATIMNLLIK
jgi:protein involved in polysaccharide export with SLBB domain